MPFKNNRQIYIYRFVLALFTVSAAVLHSTPINGHYASPSMFILIPVTASIGMFEKELAGAFFGALAGIIMDISSSLPDGSCALFLALTGFICGMLSRYVLRNNLLSALILTLVFTVSGAFLGYAAGWSAYASPAHYFRAVLLTLASLPVVYLAVRFISKAFKASSENESV